MFYKEHTLSTAPASHVVHPRLLAPPMINDSTYIKPSETIHIWANSISLFEDISKQCMPLRSNQAISDQPWPRESSWVEYVEEKYSLHAWHILPNGNGWLSVIGMLQYKTIEPLGQDVEKHRLGQYPLHGLLPLSSVYEQATPLFQGPGRSASMCLQRC